MSTSTVSTPARVTARQTEVVRLLARGYTFAGAAAALGVKERTVKQHADTLRMKFRVNTARELPAAFMDATGVNPWPQGGVR